MKTAKSFLPLNLLLQLSLLFITPLIAQENEPVDVDLLEFEVWQRESGYWFGEYIFLNGSGMSDYKATDDPTGGQYDYRKYYGFINLQVKGAQLKQRNIFLRPALDLEEKDLNKNGTVSINELNAFGFSSPYDYAIDLDTKIATPLEPNGDATELSPFNYTEATEKTFIADQSASDQFGNLSGSYFGFPTSTTIIGDDTVLYRVGDSTIFQNQLTTLPGNGTRVRTAQGFSFVGSLPSYGSYYRETKFEDDIDESGVITKTAKEKFLERLTQYRELHKVPAANQIPDVETFFTTGLETKEPTKRENTDGAPKEETQQDESFEVDLLDFEVWQRERGYWFGEYTFLNGSGMPDYKATDDPTGGQYDYRKYYGFINLQVKGAQLKQRNIFLRPALDLEQKDLNKNGTVSINELNAFGFSSPYDYAIDLDTKIATPLEPNGDATELSPFNYTEATEKTFTADQIASDQFGNLSGSYFGFPTSTTIIGDDTVLYRVGDSTIFQNQLTTLPGNGTRVRTAQGFSFVGSLPSYGSYYRETKFEDDIDERGIITKTAEEKFLEKLTQYRELHNVPVANQTPDVETFFTTGLEANDISWQPEVFLSYVFNQKEINRPHATVEGSHLIVRMTLVNDPDLNIKHHSSANLSHWKTLTESIDYSIVSDEVHDNGTHTLTLRINGEGTSFFYRTSIAIEQ